MHSFALALRCCAFIGLAAAWGSGCVVPLSVGEGRGCTDAHPSTSDECETSANTGGLDGGTTRETAESTTLVPADTSTSSPDPVADSDTSAGSGEGGTTSAGMLPDNCDEVDVPDADGIDENGDGIDGLAFCSVFVDATLGDDLDHGLTADHPVATLAHGLAIAASTSPTRPVLVAAGTYPETVTLVAGASLYGGYDGATWARDPLRQATEILGQESRTLVADALDAPTEVDGITIRGASFMDLGQSTYAVWVRDTPAGLLVFDHCIIEAGDAGHGTSGADGVVGFDGADGMDGQPDGTAGPSGASACGAVGGMGGNGMVCPSTGGSDGSAGGDPTAVGTGSAPGVSMCGADCDDSGSNAGPGSAGSIGDNGSGATTSSDGVGTFGGDGLWIPPGGSPGTRGLHGGGGGGGGAGGFDNDPGPFCLFEPGPHAGGGGGGGGAGGCGGEAGGSGQAGGSSFGLVAVSSSLTVTHTALSLGRGGDGGSGGRGSNGGQGGAPGLGVPGLAVDQGVGGDGASGGGGGGGGGGAGGCGGSAFGIVTVAGASVTLDAVDIQGGSSGLPGVAGNGGIRADGLGTTAPPGEDGCVGLVASTQDLS